MKKAVVTGAASFIGIHLINKLLEENWFVYAVVRKGSGKAARLPDSNRIKFICLDMCGYAQIGRMVGERCDAYVSLAWDGTRGGGRTDKKRQELNYKYSMDALKSMKEIGCSRVISAGSQAEYGFMQKTVSEDDACRPNTEYGIWKLKYFQEGMKFCEKNRISFREPRFFSLYGEDDNDKTMVLSMLDNMLKNKTCRMTQCTQLWDFLYIDDAVDGLYRLILDDTCLDGAYNFGTGDIRPLKEFVMEMHQLTNSKSELLFGAVPYPETGIVNVCPDTRKLREQTGWNAKVSFSEGIRRIIEYKRMRLQG